MKKKIVSAMLIIVMVLTTISSVPVFASSNPSSWAVEEVSKAKNEGLVTDSVMVDYQANITREQFCEMVVRAYGKISGENAEVGNMYFSDTDNVAILKAANLGIVAGYGNNVFGPNDLITREQIAAMLVRMIDKSVSYVNINVYNNNNFNDRDYISQWAIPSVNFAYDKGIMQGVGNNCIDPQANTTCEQAILLVYRTTQEFIYDIESKEFVNKSNLTQEQAQKKLEEWLGNLGTWVAGEENVLVCDGLYRCDGKGYYQFRLKGWVFDHITTLTTYVISADGTEIFEGECSNGYLKKY